MQVDVQQKIEAAARFGKAAAAEEFYGTAPYREAAAQAEAEVERLGIKTTDNTYYKYFRDACLKEIQRLKRGGYPVKTIVQRLQDKSKDAPQSVVIAAVASHDTIYY